ncbi:methionyl-tRNA formyltransferase [Trueperella bonasi]|uniref:Methionyl-tRNA formyltransferase n=1 Tax=Trueperella bonasi TaxID=312286 RepID=A0ABT9NDJ0_9ACTO|nr:methionyl-tRNA formyltransferase [Trueperella bonasi]MDP9805451.1 methionyl-tRNA formyltransferase [Trueperella bonasi]
MRILFAGTPNVAVPALEALVRDHKVVGVLTRAPAPVGRKRVITKSAIHERALALEIPVMTPSSLKDAVIQEEIASYEPDAVAVVAYGMLVPKELLTVPRFGWINLHFSCLPRWRGAAPVQYAIAAGDTQTGTAVFQIQEGLDTGPVFDIAKRELTAADTAGDLLEELAKSGAKQLSRVLSAIEVGEAKSMPQEGEPTFAPRLTSKDARMIWSQPAEQISAQSRGWWPAPGAWTELGTTRVKLGPVAATSIDGLAPGEIRAGESVLVGTSTTAVELSSVAQAGKPWMCASDWARGLVDKAFEIGGGDE